MIRLITEKAEKERIIRLCDEAFQEGMCAKEDFEERLEKIDRFAEFYAAFSEGEPAGYAAMYNNDRASKAAYISSIGVRPAFQKQKTGSALLRNCIESAKENGMKRLRLEVRKDNAGAIRFYKRHGFVREDECSPESDYLSLLL